MLKRALDIIVSLMGLILLSPFFLVVALLIRLDSPGPAIFSQTRVGRNGKPFPLYKFRSMIQDADMLRKPLSKVELSAVSFQQKDDPRITRLGRFLRRGFDELPGLLNVLRGDMSLVGPRPEVPDVVNLYSEREKIRLKVKPGITGLAIIKGRGDLTVQETLDWDIYYVEHRCFTMDLKILFATLWVVLVTGKGAR
ncbi:MAG: sugar transferase [Dehalococcoidia bacterium]|jgi:lipopolysaccharide/colanic/teichoic acid biosynthesis glycosyltransferase